ncbi:MAG: ATP-binding protein, partial [Candidatus Omnitrophota bacterium]
KIDELIRYNDSSNRHMRSGRRLVEYLLQAALTAREPGLWSSWRELNRFTFLYKGIEGQKAQVRLQGALLWFGEGRWDKFEEAVKALETGPEACPEGVEPEYLQRCLGALRTFISRNQEPVEVPAELTRTGQVKQAYAEFLIRTEERQPLMGQARPDGVFVLSADETVLSDPSYVGWALSNGISSADVPNRARAALILLKDFYADQLLTHAIGLSRRLRDLERSAVLQRQGMTPALEQTVRRLRQLLAEILQEARDENVNRVVVSDAVGADPQQAIRAAQALSKNLENGKLAEIESLINSASFVRAVAAIPYTHGDYPSYQEVLKAGLAQIKQSAGELNERLAPVCLVDLRQAGVWIDEKVVKEQAALAAAQVTPAQRDVIDKASIMIRRLRYGRKLLDVFQDLASMGMACDNLEMKIHYPNSPFADKALGLEDAISKRIQSVLKAQVKRRRLLSAVYDSEDKDQAAQNWVNFYEKDWPGLCDQITHSLDNAEQAYRQMQGMLELVEPESRQAVSERLALGIQIADEIKRALALQKKGYDIATIQAGVIEPLIELQDMFVGMEAHEPAFALAAAIRRLRSNTVKHAMDLFNRMIPEGTSASKQGKLTYAQAVDYINRMGALLRDLYRQREQLSKVEFRIKSAYPENEEYQEALRDISGDLEGAISKIESGYELAIDSKESHASQSLTKIAAQTCDNREFVTFEDRCGGQMAATCNRINLMSLIQNILNNGLHFAKKAHPDAQDPPKVNVVLSREDGFARLEISDNGGGIAAELLDIDPVTKRPKLFNLNASQREGGTGLGLTEVWAVALNHGATIEVVNRPGEGATFIIRIPAFMIPSPEPLPQEDLEGTDADAYRTIIEWTRDSMRRQLETRPGAKFVFVGSAMERAWQAALSGASALGVAERDIIYLELPRDAEVPEAVVARFLQEQGVFEGQKPVVVMDDVSETGDTIDKIKTAIGQVSPATVLIASCMADASTEWQAQTMQDDAEVARYLKLQQAIMFLRGRQFDFQVSNIRSRVFVDYEEMAGKLQPAYLSMRDLEEILSKTQKTTNFFDERPEGFPPQLMDRLPLIRKLLLRDESADTKTHTPWQRYLLEQPVKNNPSADAQRQERIFTALLAGARLAKSTKAALSPKDKIVQNSALILTRYRGLADAVGGDDRFTASLTRLANVLDYDDIIRFLNLYEHVFNASEWGPCWDSGILLMVEHQKSALRFFEMSVTSLKDAYQEDIQKTPRFFVRIWPYVVALERMRPLLRGKASGGGLFARREVFAEAYGALTKAIAADKKARPSRPGDEGKDVNRLRFLTDELIASHGEYALDAARVMGGLSEAGMSPQGVRGCLKACPALDIEMMAKIVRSGFFRNVAVFYKKDQARAEALLARVMESKTSYKVLVAEAVVALLRKHVKPEEVEKMIGSVVRELAGARKGSGCFFGEIVLWSRMEQLQRRGVKLDAATAMQRSLEQIRRESGDWPPEVVVQAERMLEAVKELEKLGANPEDARALILEELPSKYAILTPLAGVVKEVPSAVNKYRMRFLESSHEVQIILEGLKAFCTEATVLTGERRPVTADQFGRFVGVLCRRLPREGTLLWWCMQALPVARSRVGTERLIAFFNSIEKTATLDQMVLDQEHHPVFNQLWEFLKTLPEDAGHVLSREKFLQNVFDRTPAVSCYDDEGMNAYQQLWSAVGRLMRYSQRSGGATWYQVFLGETIPQKDVVALRTGLLSRGECMRSFEDFMRLAPLVGFLESRYLFELLARAAPGASLQHFYTRLIQRAAQDGRDPIELMINNPKGLLGLSDRNAPGWRQSALQPTKLLELPYIDLTAKQLVDGLASGKFDRLQNWHPFSVTVDARDIDDRLNSLKGRALIEYLLGEERAYADLPK